MTTSASSFALATLSLAWEGIKRCVTNVGASSLTNKKNTNYYFNSTTSFSGSRTRSSSTDFVCVHTRISSTYSRTVVRPMAVPYSPYVVRPMAVLYPYSQKHRAVRLRMNARACTPRAEFSDPESTALHSQKYRSSKFPDRQSIRKLHTTSLHRSRCTSPT